MLKFRRKKWIMALKWSAKKEGIIRIWCRLNLLRLNRYLPPFKDNLLNKDFPNSMLTEEVVVTDKDVVVVQEEVMPSIQFSSRIDDLLNQSMRLAVVVKQLVRSMAKASWQNNEPLEADCTSSTSRSWRWLFHCKVPESPRLSECSAWRTLVNLWSLFKGATPATFLLAAQSKDP